ncbi:hypothetical protein Goarm_013191, partial [Gossypium armourianum]|nr:hypothetical protein [Gossypium armourianum]
VTFESGGDEIPLPEEELVQISVKSSLIKSIWKTKKKFKIQVVGHNLFLISFEDEKDLELILEGCPWFFQRQSIIFDKLTQYMERKCDKKDLMHVVGSTFGGVIRS